ncbi:1-aminocyclopropane-1-carboxylate oxidase homolog 1-like isoform X1 [Arachis stenosperma]|uniref:1-aminocyclopropane-1-carboxylate oxidase homolog 1-like isoform X1 n=1 Tax=Arachis stenosperma TaxID=217475 RepID=UPI0025ABBBE0|nr:1-aminocyclopropane-1-carboxylate oxidase homolog 1-like isoform X1 [Arachis stenosperma]
MVEGEVEGRVKMINNSDDRMSELKAFDDTKSGVKGLVDGGVTKIPALFQHPLDKFPNASKTEHTMIPVIDLEGVAKDPITRQQVVSRIKEASETWGFFQVLNHGIPESVLEEMKEGIRRFFEQDIEVKKQVYTRDDMKPFVYNSNFDLYSSPALNWRDSFSCQLAPEPPKPQDLPEVCRDILLEYGTNVTKLGITLFELFSESLNLHSNYLRDMELGITEQIRCAGHYYPPCPEPELAIGTTKHSDASFLTVLLQDHIGGLQILHNDKWIDVRPVPGTLVVNIGDLLQLITNDRFKSVQHRVLANLIGPRVSFACFMGSSVKPSSKLFGPIKELLSEDSPPKYKETTAAEYVAYFCAKGLGIPVLEHFRI